MAADGLEGAVTWKGWEDFDPVAHERAVREQGNPTRKPHKYGATAVMVDGMRFASKREAHRWQELKALQHAGKVRSLDRQVRIPLHAAGGGLVGHYVADFRYFDVERGRYTTEDAKGMRLPLYAWKKRHVAAEHDIEIQEV